MPTITEQLAEALENALSRWGDCEISETEKTEIEIDRHLLAKYDSERTLQLPTEYRVTWKIDVFNAETPREAAEKASAIMLRKGTSATCFTVQAADGTVTEVDLSVEI